jgi:hypothetical protein
LLRSCRLGSSLPSLLAAAPAAAIAARAVIQQATPLSSSYLRHSHQS